jgi:GTP-binding protein
LIEGAHSGRGLGDKFLAHAERCTLLIHLVDLTQNDIFSAYETVRRELEMYGGGLDKKPEIIVLNKSDAVDQKIAASIKRKFKTKYEKKVHTISSLTPNESLKTLLRDVSNDRKEFDRLRNKIPGNHQIENIENIENDDPSQPNIDNSKAGTGV